MAGTQSAPLYVGDTTTTAAPFRAGIGGVQRTPTVCTKSVSVTTSTTSGQIIAWANPEGQSILIERVILDVTAASGACTVDVGIAADATTLNDTIIDGASTAAIAIFDHMDGTDNGANGTGKARKMTASQFITVSVASGNANGATVVLRVTYSPESAL